MDRRTFFGLTAGLLWPARDRVQSARLARLGVHLASVRDAPGADMANALRMIASLGYREVELTTADRPLDALATRRLLEGLGLAAPSRHVQMPDLFSNWRLLLRECQVLGTRHVVCGEIPQEQRATLDGYKRVADLLNPAGTITQSAGLQLVLRPHADDFRPRGAVVPYDYVLKNTSPALVKLQFDLSDLTRAGRDPLQELARYSGRVVSLHISDSAAGPAYTPVDLGKGQIDLPRILARAQQTGVSYYFVNDRRRDAPWAHAKANFAYLSQLEF